MTNSVSLPDPPPYTFLLWEHGGGKKGVGKKGGGGEGGGECDAKVRRRNRVNVKIVENE